MSSPARNLPPMNEVLARRRIRGLSRSLRRDIVLQLVREALEEHRQRLRTGKGKDELTTLGRPEILRLVEIAVLKKRTSSPGRD